MKLTEITVTVTNCNWNKQNLTVTEIKKLLLLNSIWNTSNLKDTA